MIRLVNGVDRGANLRRLMDGLKHLALVALLVSSAASATTTQYYYDELGRLVQAIRSDGSVRQYQYDASGNVVAINRVSAATLTISNVNPQIGHVGASVTIVGSGFSTVPSENQVRFGAVTATVSSATASSLVVTVPQNAVTGPITVTIGSASATSPMNYVVRPPVINGFSPAAVAVGGQVTLSGNNLNLIPGGTTISVGGTAATVVSLTNTQAVFTVGAGGGSGPIQIATSYGNVSSASSLVVAPASIGAGNIIAVATLSQDGTTQSINVGQVNKFGVFAFHAVAGQYLSFQMSTLVYTPSGGNIGYQLYSPTNTQITGGPWFDERTLHLPRITTTGTHLLAFSGNKTIQIAGSLEVNSLLEVSAAPMPKSTGTSQSKRVVFSGTAGQNLGLGLTNLVITPSSGHVQLIVSRPNGSQLASVLCFPSVVPGCQLPLRNLPDTGTYTVVADPFASAPTSFELSLSQSVTGTLTLDQPLAVSLSTGQNAVLTFSATAGQTVALNAGSVVTVPANKTVSITVYNAAGTALPTATGTGNATANLRNLAAGTYSALISIADGAPATMQVRLASGLTGTLPTDGSTSPYSATVANQDGYFTFAGTAGGNLGLGITNVVLTPNLWNVTVKINQPNGSLLDTVSCSQGDVPGCQSSLRNLPATGTYTVIVDPVAESIASYNLTLSQHVTGTLAPNTPLAVNLSVPGKHALLNFAATAGQALALNAGSIVTAPAGKLLFINVYNPSGTLVTQVNGTGSVTVNLTNLVAGTYSFLVFVANASTATMQVTLGSGAPELLPTNGTSVSSSTTVAGQQGHFTFGGTAGTTLGLGLTNLALTPNAGHMRVTVYRPNGLIFSESICWPSDLPECAVNLRNLPETGTYRLVLQPSTAQQTATFTLTLSQAITATLALGIPQGVNLTVPGQNASMTFTKSAGQTLALTVNSIVTAPAGKTVSVAIYNASGTNVVNASGSSTVTPSLSSLGAGTYTALIYVGSAATGTMQVTLQ